MATDATFRVLLIEDDTMIAETLRKSLRYKGFEVSPFETARGGLEAFRSQAFDIVLIDIQLPDGNGLDVCRAIRDGGNDGVPILILTAQLDEEWAVKGIEGGADDYVRKPYGVDELCARMTRLLERAKTPRKPLKFGPIRIDPGQRIAYAGENRLSLGKREFEILSLLIRRSDSVVTREQILDSLGKDAGIYDRTIDSHLSHLRKKLREAGAEAVQIIPVYGVGYRLEER